MILKNPIIHRYARSSLRWPGPLIYGMVYVVVVSIGIWASFERYEPMWPNRFTRLVRFLLLIEYFILHMWTAINSAMAISTEIDRKTYDFFRLLPLSPSAKAIGLMIGRNLAPLILAGINLGLVIVISHVAPRYLGWQVYINLILLLLASWWFLNTTILWLGLCLTRTRLALVAVVLALAVSAMVVDLIDPYYTDRYYTDIPQTIIDFFGMRFPSVVAIIFAFLYLGTWAFLGIIRRLRHEYEPIFSRSGAILFLAIYHVIILGLFLEPLYGQRYSTVVPHWSLICLAPVIAVAICTTRTVDQTIEHLVSHARSSIGLGTVALHSNLAFSLILVGIWVIFASFIWRHFMPADLGTIIDIPMILVFYLALALLIELVSLYGRRVRRVRGLMVLVGLLGLGQMYLPSLIEEVWDVGVGPFGAYGYIKTIGKKSPIISDWPMPDWPILCGIIAALHLGLATIYGVFVILGWLGILKAVRSRSATSIPAKG